MKIAVAGAHQSGKTYIARQLARAWHITHLSNSTRIAAKALQLESVDQLSLDERLRLQYQLYHNHQQQVQCHEGGIVFDYSTLDLAAYVAIDFCGNGLSSLELQRISEYQTICFSEYYSRDIDTLVVVHPHTEIPNDQTRPRGSLDAVITTFAMIMAQHVRVIDVPHALPLNERVSYISDRLFDV